MNSRNKKSAPGGTPIPKQDNSTMPGAESLAKFIFDRIGLGRENAVKRPKGGADRELRRMIAEANKTGDCIINVGDGYYRPGKDDEPDVRHYLNAELHRADEITEKVQSMREAYYGRY